jgi:tripartite-type tricarboxylate transporter receptor subunit TctC
MAPSLQKRLGQPVLIENRAGAGATIGTAYVGTSTPDGYTLLMGSASNAIGNAIQNKRPYVFERDFIPVMLVADVPGVVVVPSKLPIKNMQELIAYAKANEGQLNYGSPGYGTSVHLAGELFQSMTGTKMLHVPYKGGGQMVVAVISGEGQVMFSPVSTAVPHGKTGKLRLLGVSSAQRIASLPEVPTIAEPIKGYDSGGWQGLLVPAGTPADIINRLHAAVLRVIATPEFKDYAAGEGSDIDGSTPDWFVQFLKSEVTKNAALVKAAGIKPE